MRPEPELCDDESEEDEGRRKEERGKREEDLEEGERACFITNGSTLIRPWQLRRGPRKQANVFGSQRNNKESIYALCLPLSVP